MKQVEIFYHVPTRNHDDLQDDINDWIIKNKPFISDIYEINVNPMYTTAGTYLYAYIVYEKLESLEKEPIKQTLADLFPSFYHSVPPEVSTY